MKVSGLYDSFDADCLLRYYSPNAQDIRDVLGTLNLSVLDEHKRYAHITTIRSDRVNPELLGMTGVVSEDSVRRALYQFDESKERNLHNLTKLSLTANIKKNNQIG